MKIQDDRLVILLPSELKSDYEKQAEIREAETSEPTSLADVVRDAMEFYRRRSPHWKREKQV